VNIYGCKNETNGSDFGMQINSNDSSSDSMADNKFSDGMKASAIFLQGDKISQFYSKFPAVLTSSGL